MPALIAEWNRTDLSQLVSGGSPDFSAGGGSPALAVVNVAERGNVLRYTASGGATVTHIFMFSVASGLLIPSTDERRDVDIELEILDGVYGPGGYVGPFVLADADTPLHGFGHAASGETAEWQTLLNNGSVERGGGTGSSISRFSEYMIRGRKPIGAPPEVSSYSAGWGASQSGQLGEPRRSGSSSGARGGVSEFGQTSTLGATWNSISADRVGLIFQSSGGNPAPTSVDIMNLRLFEAN